jgi:hypothetical protein
VTHTGDNVDYGDGNERGGQTVFDSDRASLVFEKSGQGRVHLRAPSCSERVETLQQNLKPGLHGACAVLPQQSWRTKYRGRAAPMMRETTRRFDVGRHFLRLMLANMDLREAPIGYRITLLLVIDLAIFILLPVVVYGFRYHLF